MKKLNLSKIKPKKKLSIKEKKTKREKKVKEKKVFKKKSLSKKVIYIILIAFVTLCIVGVIALAGFFAYIAYSAPEFNLELLYEKDSTLIYDASGELIATLGVEQREKLTYDELSEVLVDAIIATEDSRFFQHNGFDFPRFMKASLGQLLGRDAGGASTLTMQVSKNTFTDTTSSGIKGIIRKFTDIYMSIFKIEKYYTKEEIIEFYVNSPFLGSGAYGVEQASQTYFGKSASDLSLPEASLIAGLFQAPGAYDPYIDSKKAEERRNQVLYLMRRHGYITKEEEEEARSISVKSLLVSDSGSVVSPYQGFIDTVVAEAREITKNDPYDVPMIIHSTLDKNKQNVVNSVYDGSAGFYFKDDVIQFATSVLDTNTGAILAIGAGRNKTTEMSFNYATQIKRHPGSTAKPLFDYGPGVEYESWSSYTPFFDENDTAYSGGQTIRNWNSSYAGFSTLRRCLIDSVNTCAVQAFQRLDQNNVREFVTSLGIEPEYSEYGTIYESHAIGAFSGVNPLQLSAAYSAFSNGGYYVEPFSITKIEYRDSDEVYEHEIVKKKAMSPQTAYLISNVLMGVTPYTVNVSGTQVATKTGTSSYDSDLLSSMGLSSRVIRDSWVATYSPDIAIVLWLGYDELDKEYNILMSRASSDREKIQGILCNGIMYPNSRFSSPGGVTSSQVEAGTIPAMLPSENTPGELIQSHLFVSGSEPTEVSTRFSQLSNATNLKYTLSDDKKLNVSWTSPGTPSAVDNEYLTNYFTTGYGKWAEKYLNERITYNNNNIGTFGFEIYLVSGTTEKYIDFTSKTQYTIDLSEYSGYNSVKVVSAYTIFKSNKSTGITKKFGDNNLSSSELSLSFPSVSLSLNETFNGSDESDLRVSLDGNAISGYNANVELSSIINSSGKSIAINKISEVAGTYTASYKVTIEYLGYTFNTKTVKETITVSNSSTTE